MAVEYAWQSINGLSNLDIELAAQYSPAGDDPALAAYLNVVLRQDRPAQYERIKAWWGHATEQQRSFLWIALGFLGGRLEDLTEEQRESVPNCVISAARDLKLRLDHHIFAC